MKLHTMGGSLPLQPQQSTRIGIGPCLLAPLHFIEDYAEEKLEALRVSLSSCLKPCNIPIDI